MGRIQLGPPCRPRVLRSPLVKCVFVVRNPQKGRGVTLPGWWMIFCPYSHIGDTHFHQKFEWDLSNGPLSKLRSSYFFVDTQVYRGSGNSGIPLDISWNIFQAVFGSLKKFTFGWHITQIGCEEVELQELWGKFFLFQVGSEIPNPLQERYLWPIIPKPFQKHQVKAFQARNSLMINLDVVGPKFPISIL